jgi:hypothetical protein
MTISIWTILVSLIVGVISNQLTPYISRFLGRISSSIKKRNERRKLIFENSVQYLLNNPHEEIIFRIRFLESSLGVVLVLLFAIVMMVSSNLIEILSGFIFSIFGYYLMARTNNRGKIREELIKRKKASVPDIDIY